MKKMHTHICFRCGHELQCRRRQCRDLGGSVCLNCRHEVVAHITSLYKK